MRIVAPESAKPLYVELHRAVWRAGGHAIGHYLPDDDAAVQPLARLLSSSRATRQLDFFPAQQARGLIDQMDHQVSVLSDADMHALEGVGPAQIMRRAQAMKPLIDWRTEKENAGRFTWTLALYGTPAMAAEAGLSEEEYWQQIIEACFLDERGPDRALARGQRPDQRLRGAPQRAPDRAPARAGRGRDLTITLGERRQWVGGSGRNIPSFEIFTSPDWRGTEGWIRFNQPLYRYGNLIEGIRLEFADGRVVKATAERNEKVLIEMVATENADKVGEFSLTDSRFSRITKFMAETLYDENVGGPFGNTHIALGKSYHDCYAGDPACGRAASGSGWASTSRRPHGHRLDDRPHGHRALARRQRARDLRGGPVPARLIGARRSESD